MSDREGALRKKSVTVSVDGSQLGFDYARGKGVLAPKLTRGKHTVVVTATDSVGVVSTRQWSFTIKRR